MEEDRAPVDGKERHNEPEAQFMNFLEAMDQASGLAPRGEEEGHQAAGDGHIGKDRQAEGLDHPGQPLAGGPFREPQPQEVQTIFSGQLEPFGIPRNYSQHFSP